MSNTPYIDVIAEKASSSSEPKFRWAYDPAESPHRKSFDRTLIESENFIVIPTLGSLVPGWVLIIPKFHLQKFSEFPEELGGEFTDLTTAVRSTLAPSAKNFFVFEHGAQKESPMGCGVDQGHMHAVILDFDLLELSSSAPEVSWMKGDGLLFPYHQRFSIKAQSEYLYVSNGLKSMVGSVEKPVSQWFRRLIAAAIGCPDVWDYRSCSFDENIQRTIGIFERK